MIFVSVIHSQHAVCLHIWPLFSPFHPLVLFPLQPTYSLPSKVQYLFAFLKMKMKFTGIGEQCRFC